MEQGRTGGRLISFHSYLHIDILVQCGALMNVTGDHWRGCNVLRESEGPGSNLIRSPITVYDLWPATLYIDKTLEITMEHITTGPYMLTLLPQNIHYGLTEAIFQFISASSSSSRTEILTRKIF